MLSKLFFPNLLNGLTNTLKQTGPAILTVSTCLLTSAPSFAERSVNHANELYFEFLANSGEANISNSLSKQNAHKSQSDFVEGSVLSGKQLFTELSSRGPKSISQSQMEDTYLVARLWNMSEEIFSHGVVAYCAQLDFMSAEAAPLDQVVRCDEKLFSVAIDDKGVLLMEDGKPLIRYELASGLYALNSVPFLVE